MYYQLLSLLARSTCLCSSATHYPLVGHGSCYRVLPLESYDDVYVALFLLPRSVANHSMSWTVSGATAVTMLDYLPEPKRTLDLG